MEERTLHGANSSSVGTALSGDTVGSEPAASGAGLGGGNLACTRVKGILDTSGDC